MANSRTDTSDEISKKLNVLIALSIRGLLGQEGFSARERAKHGVGDVIRFLADMGLEAKDIAPIVGSPISSVRTLLTPARRK